MLRKSFLRSRILSLSVLLCCGASFAQTSALALQPQASSVTGHDPTKPETQPSLSVDRDPIVSPDPQDNVLVSQPPPQQGPATAARPGEIQKGQRGLYTLEENVNEVLLNCTVVDDKGHLVRDLKQGDFRVFENSTQQTIASFQHRDLPVSMGILVDNSGSMIDKRAAVTAAALDLVRASNPADSAFIVNFSDRAYLDQGFTSDINQLERGLSRFDARGMTALYDAVAASADELSKNSKQPKQVLLIITDGADNASRLDLQQAIRRVTNLGGPVVYSIGLLFDDDKKEAADARNALETLSSETGGLAYFPSSLQEVSGIAAEVARDIRNQYIVGYHSTIPANVGGYRTVHVEAQAPGHGKLIVRARKGYYPRAAAQRRQQTAQSAPAPQ